MEINCRSQQPRDLQKLYNKEILPTTILSDYKIITQTCDALLFPLFPSPSRPSASSFPHAWHGVPLLSRLARLLQHSNQQHCPLLPFSLSSSLISQLSNRPSFPPCLSCVSSLSFSPLLDLWSLLLYLSSCVCSSSPLLLLFRINKRINNKN